MLGLYVGLCWPVLALSWPYVGLCWPYLDPSWGLCSYMFVWDPRESVPYLIAPENINRCKLKVPRNARICASRVVEYVPEYDQHLSPRAFIHADRLTPVSTAVPAEPAQDAESGYTPSFVGEDVARSAVVAEADSPSEPAAASSGSRDGVVEGAAPSAPSNPLDDKLLVELGDGVPFKDDVLKKEATSHQHLLTHYTKNPYCPLCHIAKDTAMRVSHTKMVNLMMGLILQSSLLNTWQPMMFSSQRDQSILGLG